MAKRTARNHTRKRRARPAREVRALTAGAFFRRRFEGFRKADAARATELDWTVVCRAAKDGSRSQVASVMLLQKWSLRAIPQYGCYIDAAKTLGVSPPRSLS